MLRAERRGARREAAAHLYACHRDAPFTPGHPLSLPLRVRPSTSIALVVELQAAGGFDAYGLEIQRLASRGWAKITLFDQLHQVISGRWKIPVRVLPVKPGLTTEQLNGVPQVSGFSRSVVAPTLARSPHSKSAASAGVSPDHGPFPQAGKTELYLRVVNARDADVQSLAEIDPGNASLYRFPPTVSSDIAFAALRLDPSSA